MKCFSDINLSELSIFDAVITACKMIRQDFSVRAVALDLKNKIIEAQFHIAPETDLNKKLLKLLELFYVNWHFGNANGIYKISDTLWIDKVLNTGKGTASSLGIIFFYIAQKLHLPLNLVIFPTQLILKTNSINGNTFFINPCNGEFLNKHILKSWLKGHISPTFQLCDNNLSKAKSSVFFCKFLNALKAALIEEKNMELALKISNLLLQINPKNSYERRDRGLIYAQLECNHVAVSDLMYFVKNCPDDPSNEIIKLQIYAMNQKKIILH